MSNCRVVYRCVECDFLIDPDGPRILTEFGWAHPVCSIAEATP